MAYQEDFHGSELVHGTGQIEFLVPGEVAQIGKSEGAVGEQETDRAGVLGIIDVALRGAGADGIFQAATGERLGNHGAVGRDDGNVHAFEWNAITGLNHLMLSFGDSFVIGEVFANDFGVLAVGPVVEPCADGNPVGQLRSAADMIAMVVGDQDIIDFLDMGFLRGLDNAAGIAAVVDLYFSGKLTGAGYGPCKGAKK